MSIAGGRHHARARFYDELARMLDAGLAISDALRTIGSGPDRLAGAAGRLEDRIRGGATIAGALEAEPRTFTPFERHAVGAGERAGRLPETLRQLSAYFQVRGDALDRVALGLIYPALLLHLAIFLPTLGILFSSGMGGYIRAVFPPLLVIWGAAAAVVLTARAAGEKKDLRRRLDGIALALPGAGGIARKIALADYAHALGLLYESGVPIMEALDRAAEATGNAIFADAGRRVAQSVRGGSKLAEALALESAVFPELFIQTVRVGETSGTLDATLARASRLAREESERAIKAVSVGLPVAIYLFTMVYVAWVIISTYAGIFGEYKKYL